MAVRSDFSEKVRNSDFSPKMGQIKVCLFMKNQKNGNQNMIYR